MRWKELLMLLVCLIVEPFLLLTLYGELRGGNFFNAGICFMAVCLVANIGAGIWNGDIRFD